MIKAYIGNRPYRVHGLANKGQWFGKHWLIMIAIGYDTLNTLVEADNAQDAIDEFTDSKYGHLIKTDDLCENCEREDYDRCECSFAGNYSERVDLDYVTIHKVDKVDYFAKREEAL
jgi:hypothetical protein